MVSKQQGDEIGIASEEQEDFDGQNVHNYSRHGINI